MRIVIRGAAEIEIEFEADSLKGGAAGHRPSKSGQSSVEEDGTRAQSGAYSKTPISVVPGGGDMGTAGNEASPAPVAANHPTVLDEPSVIAIREGRVEVAPTPDIPGAMATIGNQVRAAVDNPPQPVERPAELDLSRPHTDDLAFPDFLDRRKGRAA